MIWPRRSLRGAFVASKSHLFSPRARVYKGDIFTALVRVTAHTARIAMSA
jgi:hypothetical protein